MQASLPSEGGEAVDFLAMRLKPLKQNAKNAAQPAKRVSQEPQLPTANVQSQQDGRRGHHDPIMDELMSAVPDDDKDDLILQFDAAQRLDAHKKSKRTTEPNHDSSDSDYTDRSSTSSSDAASDGGSGAPVAPDPNSHSTRSPTGDSDDNDFLSKSAQKKGMTPVSLEPTTRLDPLPLRLLLI